MLYYPRCRIGCYKFLLTLSQPTKCNMLQLQKYTWLIDTIRKAGKISLEEISDRWERNKELSDYKPLSRATFNRWKDAIFSQFGISSPAKGLAVISIILRIQRILMKMN